MTKLFGNRWSIFLMVLPGLGLLLFAMITPVILSVYYGMTDWSGIGKMNFIGFSNYTDIFKDTAFWISLKNALTLTLVTIFIQNPFAIIIGIMLLNCKKGERTFRTIYFIPAVISVVVTTKLWVNILNPNYGLINKFLHLIGLGFLRLTG